MQLKKILSAIGFAVLTAAVLYTPSCQREPVYIGDNSGYPIDTTGNGIPCNPDSVYFNQQILPILTSNCAMSGCHDVASHEEGVILNNYQNTRNTGQISLSNPANSKLYKVLNDDDPAVEKAIQVLKSGAQVARRQ